jgi:hypothetical protein
LAFIDNAKAYDLNRQEICEALQRANVFKGVMEGTKKIYRKCAKSMVIDGKVS